MPTPASTQERVVDKSLEKVLAKTAEEPEEEESFDDSSEEEDVDAVAASLHTKRTRRKAIAKSAACAKLCREGGTDLVNFMLAQAVGPGTGSSELPTNSPRNWTFQDLT
jgi:hypothetical protein